MKSWNACRSATWITEDNSQVKESFRDIGTDFRKGTKAWLVGGSIYDDYEFIVYVAGEISSSRFERFVRISRQVWYARNESPVNESDRHSLICRVTACVKARFNHLAELKLSLLGHMPNILQSQSEIFAFLVSEFNPLIKGINEHAVSHAALPAAFDWVYEKTTTWTIITSDFWCQFTICFCWQLKIGLS